MGSPLDDERIQFFLRHRNDIRAWMQIEPDVTAAVRIVLAELQPVIEERLVAIDANVTTSRRDGGRWERIMARRPVWPEQVGVTLEWEAGVDPFGSALPKVGVIFLSDRPESIPGYGSFAEACRADDGLRSAGFKPADRVWPVMRRVAKSNDWWRDVETWTAGIVDAVVDLWPRVAPHLDAALGELGVPESSDA